MSFAFSYPIIFCAYRLSTSMPRDNRCALPGIKLRKTFWINSDLSFIYIYVLFHFGRIRRWDQCAFLFFVSTPVIPSHARWQAVSPENDWVWESKWHKCNKAFIFIKATKQSIIKDKQTTKQIVTIKINEQGRRSHATLVVLCLSLCL